MKTPIELDKEPAMSQKDSLPTLQKPLRYEPKPKGSWKALVGIMKDCDLAPEAFRLGAEWREQMNREGK